MLHAHAAATLFMTGLIWFVQLVHYPLLGAVGREHFTRYEREHMRRTGWVVTAPMFVELGTALWLVWARPAALPAAALWAGLGLLVVIWGSTILLQMPAHMRLEKSFDAATHTRLVQTNWIRTVAWTARTGLVLFLV